MNTGHVGCGGIKAGLSEARSNSFNASAERTIGEQAIENWLAPVSFTHFPWLEIRGGSLILSPEDPLSRCRSIELQRDERPQRRGCPSHAGEIPRRSGTQIPFQTRSSKFPIYSNQFHIRRSLPTLHNLQLSKTHGREAGLFRCMDGFTTFVMRPSRILESVSG